MKKVVPSWWCCYQQSTAGKAKPDYSSAERSGQDETNRLFTTRGEIPLELDYAQTYGMGASGAAMVKAAPQ